MKKLKRVVLVLLVLSVLALVAVALAFDRIARVAVEEGGSYALGVPTRLERLSIGLLSSESHLAGLEVSNPEGFDAAHFLRVGSGDLRMSLGALAGDVIEVPELALADISIHLQRRGGKTNYGVVLDNLERLDAQEPGQPGSEQPPGGEPRDPGDPRAPEGGKRFLVRRILITDVRVDFDLLPAGGDLTKASAVVPRLELTDVGTAEGGATLADLTTEVVEALLQASLQAGGQVLSPALLEDLRSALADLGTASVHLEGVRAEIEQLDEALGTELGGKVDEALKDLGKDVGDSLDDLFKKKK